MEKEERGSSPDTTSPLVTSTIRRDLRICPEIEEGSKETEETEEGRENTQEDQPFKVLISLSQGADKRRHSDSDMFGWR